MANGLMGGIGAGLSGFEEAFSRAQGRQDLLAQNANKQAMMQAQIDAQAKERARQIQGQAATNALIAGVGQGGMMGAQAPPIGIASPQALQYSGQRVPAQQAFSMPEAQQQALFGQSLAGADMAKVLAAQQSMQPKAVTPNIVTKEVMGPDGFGTYAFNLDAPDSKPRFLGGGKPESPGSGVDTEGEQKLRKEFSGHADYFDKISNSYSTIKALSKKDSPAGDIGLVFAVMKMFDPGSVVRESEFATAQNAAGVPERVRNVYNQAMEGVRLSPSQRLDFANTAGNIYNEQRNRFVDTADYYSGIAESSGFEPERIVRVPKDLRGDRYSGAINANTPLQTTRQPDATTAADALINKYRVQ